MKHKILIVEDEKLLSDALAKSLEENGFDIARAVNGAEALAIAEKEAPSLILLDVIMPKMNGWEFFRELRKKGKWGQEVPVILLTNLKADNDEELKNVVELKPRYFLIKTDSSLESIVEKVKEEVEWKN